MNPHLGNGIGRFVSQTLAEQTGGVSYDFRMWWEAGEKKA